MAKTITLIRHAETNANAAHTWQGSADWGISDRGNDQIDRLAKRVAGWRPDVVYASDLPRTMATSEVMGGGIPTPGFREFAIGRWEGLTSTEIHERYPDEWEAFLRWEDIAPGGGERLSAFAERVNKAFDDVADGLPDGGHGVVFTHGGVIWALLGAVTGVGGGGPMIPSHNTAISTVTIHDDGSRSIATFNDATHLDSTPTQFGPDGRLVTLVRHGQSEGNVAGTWDASTDTPLTELGKEQAKAVAPYVPHVDHLFSSPLRRTTATAEIIADRFGTPVKKDEGLVEMSFGAWEGLTTAEILERHPHDIAAYEQGTSDDLPRGGNGESLTGAGLRMRETTERLAGACDDAPYVAVSHGAAIRALTVNVLGLTQAGRGRISIPRNTAMSSFIMSDSRMVLASFNVAPHLED